MWGAHVNEWETFSKMKTRTVLKITSVVPLGAKIFEWAQETWILLFTPNSKHLLSQTVGWGSNCYLWFVLNTRHLLSKRLVVSCDIRQMVECNNGTCDSWQLFFHPIIKFIMLVKFYNLVRKNYLITICLFVVYGVQSLINFLSCSLLFQLYFDQYCTKLLNVWCYLSFCPCKQAYWFNWNKNNKVQL